MRSFILLLKRIGLQKIVGVLIAVVLIIVAGTYMSSNTNTQDTGYQASFDEGKYAQNIPELEDWVKKHPDDLNSLELLAASYIQKVDAEPINAKLELTKAIKILNQIVSKNQRRSETYRLIGTVRMYQNNIPSAEASFNQAIVVSAGKNLNAEVGLGMVLESKGDWDNAFIKYRSVLAKDSTNEMAILGSSRYHVYSKNHNLAKETASTLLLTTKNNAVKGEAYAILGSADMLIRDYKNATENFKKSLSYRPGNVHTQVLLGDALIGQYRSAPEADWASLTNQITDAANKAILIKPDYIYAYTLLYKANLIQNKYPEANKIGKKILALLKTDKVLSEAEKREYEKYYNGEIESVTITSLSNLKK